MNFICILLIVISFKAYEAYPIQGEITCESNKDCAVDCTSTNCNEYTITATTALSLNISCNRTYPAQCQMMTVYCPYSTSSTCQINCNANQCRGTKINYPQPQNIYINCYGAGSCPQLQLLGPDTFSNSVINSNVTVFCPANNSCTATRFDANYISNATFYCKGPFIPTSNTPYQGSYEVACREIIIHSNYANHVQIDCWAYDCISMQLHANNVSGRLLLNCWSSGACVNSTIYALYSNFTRIGCRGSLNSCGNYSARMNIYAPYSHENALNISCPQSAAGNSPVCYINVYVPDEYVLNYMNIISQATTTYNPNTINTICKTRGNTTIRFSYNNNVFECKGKPLCCPWKYGDYVCNNPINDTDVCIVDCKTVSTNNVTGCDNKVIDAVNAKSLTVICDSDATLSDHGYGCSNATIFGSRDTSQIHTLSVNCLYPLSCKSSIIWPYQNNMNLLCNNTESCSNSTLKANNTYNTNVICDGNSTSHSMMINVANIIGSFTILCNGTYACWDLNISAINAKSIKTTAIGDASLYNSTINGQFAGYFQVECGSRYSINKIGACYNTKLYGKSNGLSDLECQAYGCSFMKLYSKNGINDWNITFDGCQECQMEQECVNVNVVTQQFTQTLNINTEISYCSLENPDVICGDGKNCVIDCDSSFKCNGLAISGSEAKSLTVNCEYCTNTIIYCPFNNPSLCSITCDSSNNYLSCYKLEIYVALNTDIVLNCTAAFSCNYVELYANNSNQITVNCFQNNSCNSINIYATNANILEMNCMKNGACVFVEMYVQNASSVNLTCLGVQSNGSLPSCSGFTINAQYLSNKLIWKCYGTQSCSRNDIYVNYANEIVVSAHGYNALYYGRVFAQNAKRFNLTCYLNNACYSSVFEAPQKSSQVNSHLNCYGTGCHSLNLDSHIGFDDWLIKFNGCGQCNAVAYCINYWYLVCSNGINYFYGDSCKYNDPSDCQCSKEITVLNASFINNQTMCTLPY